MQKQLLYALLLLADRGIHAMRPEHHETIVDVSSADSDEFKELALDKKREVDYWRKLGGWKKDVLSDGALIKLVHAVEEKDFKLVTDLREAFYYPQKRGTKDKSHQEALVKMLAALVEIQEKQLETASKNREEDLVEHERSKKTEANRWIVGTTLGAIGTAIAVIAFGLTFKPSTEQKAFDCMGICLEDSQAPVDACVRQCFGPK